MTPTYPQQVTYATAICPGCGRDSAVFPDQPEGWQTQDSVSWQCYHAHVCGRSGPVSDFYSYDWHFDGTWLVGIVTGMDTREIEWRGYRRVEAVLTPGGQIDPQATEALIRSFGAHVVVLIAGKGRGKTHFMRHVASSAAGRKVVTNPRQSLCEEQAAIFGLPNYQTLSGDILGDAVVCSNSLHRIKRVMRSTTTGWVPTPQSAVSLFLCDEIEQVVRGLSARLYTDDSARTTFAALKQHIRESGLSILSDADAAEGVEALLRGLDPARVIALVAPGDTERLYSYTTPTGGRRAFLEDVEAARGAVPRA